MTLPFLKFYVRDWMSDPQLRMVSLAARGYWLECLCLMHMSARRGYLETPAGRPITEDDLARLSGTFNGEGKGVRAELLDHGVPSVEDVTGVWYCRRMVRDEGKAAKCAAAGKRGGGNPLLACAAKNATSGDAENPPCNPSKKIPETRYHISLKVPFKGDLYRSFDTLETVAGFEDAWAAWLDWRKKKRAPVTDRVARNVLTRLSERPTEAVAGLDTCMAAGWTDVRWDWIDNRNAKTVPRQNGYAARDPDAVSPEIKAKQARIQQVNGAVIKAAQSAGRQLSQSELMAVHRQFAGSIGRDERRSGVEQAINSAEYGLLARFGGKAAE